MSKSKIIEFFDACAPRWDAEMVKNDMIMNTILDNCRIGRGDRVLDVACGTGVLFDYYLSRDVAAVTGIDISSKMALIASEKYKGKAVLKVICGDIETETFETKFDRAMVYNAFPHFLNPENLIIALSRDIRPGGIVSIAHGMSRDRINSHHSHLTDDLSCDLMPVEKLAEMLDPYFTVDIMISDDKMFQVCGIKK